MRIENVIGGKRCAPGGSRTNRRLNPSNVEDVITEYRLSSQDDVANAVQAARMALPDWSRMAPVLRGEYLTEAAAVIRESLKPMATAMSREIGKPVRDAEAEVLVGAKLLEFYGSESLRYGGESLPSANERVHLFTQRRPVGVVGLITPWNFPVSIPAWKLGPALLCGNTVVWKPALQNPASTMAIIEAFERAGIPDGVINLVHGDGPDVGQAVVDHPDVAAVSFTGSRAVGTEVYRRGSSRLARISCEMGGKNPILVLADADIDLATDLTIQGGFSFAGQKCTATSRAIIDRAIRDEFSDLLVEKARKLVMGDAACNDTDMGPVVDDRQFDRVRTMIEGGLAQGAKALCGGTDARNTEGYFISPTVFDCVDPSMTVAQEEIFGPVLSLFEVEGLEQGLALANQTPYGLSASICTTDLDRAYEFIDEIEAGVIGVNRPTAGSEYQAPFGGVKGSGLGPTEQGLKVLEFYSHWRTVNLKFG